VLVAGCGTGAELVEALAQRPDWQITALDPSASMLAAAQARLGTAGDEAIRWRQARVEELDQRLEVAQKLLDPALAAV
jgi:tRNA (cmo5U34)-methyltransferase